MNGTQMEIKIAEAYLEMNETEKKLLLEIMELIANRPDRRQYVLNYTGRMADLPAALVQI